MRPNIDFHHIAAIRLSPVQSFEARVGDCHAFSSRHLVLVDKDGNEFDIGLFADKAESLRIAGDPEPAEPVPGVVEWVDVADFFDRERAEMAIERWHVEHGIASPSDSEFAAARWSIPDGTEQGNHPDRPTAERLRVEMPCRNVYELHVEFDADLRGDRYVEQRTYCVENFSIPQPQEQHDAEVAADPRA